MPSARPAPAAPPRRQPRAPVRRRHRVRSRAPGLRIRWERVGRIGLLVVLTVVVGLYAEHTRAYFSTRSQADRQQAIVSSLAAQNAALERQREALNDPATIVRDARALGMVRPSEQAYVVTGATSH